MALCKLVLMSIPDYQTVMLPLTGLISDGKEHSFKEAVEALADHFESSEEKPPAK